MPASKIPFERLVDLVEGRLPEDERAELLAQVAASPRASREVAQLASIVELMRTDDAEDAPPHVVARAARLFRQRSAPEAPSLRQRLRAVLQFDSAQRPLAMGVRSGHTLTRQLLFTSEVRDLDLRISPSDSLWTRARSSCRARLSRCRRR
jgi:anti-sigma factor RsiW